MITIATSIAPRNIEHQQSAIDSWLALGFAVISVNSCSEIELLSPLFPSIEFVVSDRNAKAKTGRAYIFFDDIRTALIASASKVCGIINSDIHLKAGPDFYAFVRRTAHDGLLFGSRMDVDSLDRNKGNIYFLGFDFFFFDRSVLACYPASEFCIGAPWWDYWMLLIPIRQGKCCRELVSPIAFHLKHPMNWSFELLSSFGSEVYSYISTVASDLPVYGRQMRMPVSINEHKLLSYRVLHYIHDNAGEIACNKLPLSRCVFKMLRALLLSIYCAISELDCEIEESTSGSKGVLTWAKRGDLQLRVTHKFIYRCFAKLLRLALRKVHES